MPQPTKNPQPIGLPPPGYKRVDELKARTDNLEQKGEELAAVTERHTLDPKHFEPIREIRYQMDMLDVTNKDPNYEYKWVNSTAPSSAPGVQVRTALSTQVYLNNHYQAVWEIVKGDMKEALGQRQADGTRKIGDTILLRAKKELHAALTLSQQQKQMNREQSITAELEQLSFQAQRMGLAVVHPDMSVTHPERMLRAERTARERPNPTSDQVNQMLRDGTVPGAEFARMRK